MERTKLLNDFRVFVEQHYGQYETHDHILRKNMHYFSNIVYGIFAEDEERATDLGLGEVFTEFMNKLTPKELFDKYLCEDWMVAEQKVKDERLDAKNKYWADLEKATSTHFVTENQEQLGYHKTAYEQLNEFTTIIHKAFQDFLALNK